MCALGSAPGALAAPYATDTADAADTADATDAIDAIDTADADDTHAADAEEPVETLVVVGESEGAALTRSAAAVRVVELDRARVEAADLGEVLARTEGVGARRAGGLGAESRLSLDGFDGDRVRVLLDGLPLAWSGLASDVAHIPVNLLDRVEIYRGVVPVRFGADALGGAIDLVTDDAFASDAALSYQLGAWGTHRLTAAGRYAGPDGFVARATGFFDRALNDYPVEVEVPDERGRLAAVEVERFHDGWRAAGGALMVGVVDRPWAERLTAEGFVHHTDKEIQHDTAMIVPYGEPTTTTWVAGGTVRYRHAFAGLTLDAAAGYARRQRDFVDVGEHVYGWDGTRLRERARPGEVAEASDRSVWEDALYGRLVLGGVFDAHALELAVTPSAAQRSGEERRVQNRAGFDPLDAERALYTVVSGLEYTLTLFDEALEVVAFGKSYLYAARADEPLRTGGRLDRDHDAHHVGYGAAARVALLDALSLKASYERATRLPTPEEVFGDAAFTAANLTLRPEQSHNLNVEAALDAETPIGGLRATVGGVQRDAEQLILRLARAPYYVHQNAYRARARGVEAALGWRSPGRRLSVDGNVTWLDLRNTSSDGPFATFEGERIPNQPYLFANGAIRLDLPDVLRGDDRLTLGWDTRYVHGFLRTWESLGAGGDRPGIPSQLTHAALASYGIDAIAGVLTLTGAVEVHNLTDARTYDFFGVQRPGRSAFVKVTAHWQPGGAPPNGG